MMSKKTNQEKPQIIKTRDDREPIYFIRIKDTEDFMLCEGSTCSWVNPGDRFNISKLRERIEPWLTALFQSEHLSLLVGSGLTNAVYNIAVGYSPQGMGKLKFNIFTEQIDDASWATAKAAGRHKPNFEDQIRVAIELLVGLRHYCNNSTSNPYTSELCSKLKKLEQEISYNIRTFSESILQTEHKVALAQKESREKAFYYLISFLMSFASRTGMKDRLHIFTTNYDRFIEAGADIAGLRLIDRFVGILTPIFRASRLDIDMHYNPPGIRGEPRYLEGVARFTKLHGSLDWINVNGAIRRFGLPFGALNIQEYLQSPGLDNAQYLQLMIYPNSAKDRETSEYPYAELFRDFASAICRPNSTLVTYGYGFGDDHINRIIEDMLTIPSTHLVIIARSDSYGRMIKLCERQDYRAQITILIGDHLGDIKMLVDHYLPKPAIDRTMIRMAKLLEQRFGIQGEAPLKKISLKNGEPQNESDAV